MMQSKHLRVIALLILICGGGSAIALYVTAEPTSVDPLDYDRFASKKYTRDLERFGGKFAVLTAELSQWCAGLWHGKPLAILIAILSLALAWLLWFISTPIPADQDLASEDSNNRNCDSP